MVANRALAPYSKRGVEEWVKEDVALGNPEPIALHHLYRSMDVLLEQRELIHKEVFFAVTDLLNLEVDLLFFDTTSTYLETEDEGELKKYGHSKDHRSDLPQIVIGLAVTKEGIPVKCWVLPGNTSEYEDSRAGKGRKGMAALPVRMGHGPGDPSQGGRPLHLGRKTQGRRRGP